jgi:hypothetical protein
LLLLFWTVTVVVPPDELPPKKPPLKKPPPKPKPPPELPPTITGMPPLLPVTATGGGGGGGTNIGGTMVRVVTVWAGAARQTVRRISRRATRRFDVLLRTTPFSTVAARTFAWLTIAGRGGGLAAS